MNFDSFFKEVIIQGYLVSVVKNCILLENKLEGSGGNNTEQHDGLEQREQSRECMVPNKPQQTRKEESVHGGGGVWRRRYLGKIPEN